MYEADDGDAMYEADDADAMYEADDGDGMYEADDVDAMYEADDVDAMSASSSCANCGKLPPATAAAFRSPGATAVTPFCTFSLLSW